MGLSLTGGNCLETEKVEEESAEDTTLQSDMASYNTVGHGRE